jgi:hypothetical protein
VEGVFSELRPYEDEHGVTFVGGCLTLRLAYGARRVPRDAGGHRAPVGLLVRAEAAGEGGLQVFIAGANMGRHEAYRALLARGFRTDIQGVTMHRSNDPGYSQPGVYVIDDWR